MSSPRLFCVWSSRGLVSVVLSLCLGLGSALAETARVAATTANLRAAPGTSGRLVATLPRGARVEILGSDGDWLRVRAAESGAEGFVLGRLVEREAPAAPPAATAPVTVTPPPAPPPAEPGLRITHDDVACVVAGRYPKLMACFNPEENLGRARVLFRAVGTDPWYYVDMSRDGACHSAILPKPRAGTPAFQYYVHTLDRSFFQVQDPAAAPDQAFSPRVVKKQGECAAGRKVALVVGKLVKPVRVGVALDPSGGALAASAAGAPVNMPLTGFSTDGVELGGLGKAPPRAGESSGNVGAQAGGIPKVALIGGGVAAAGAAVAVAAGGGGSGGGSGSGGSGSGGGGGGGGGGTGGSGLSVAGQWAGRVDQGAGLTYVFGDADLSCTFRYDVTLNLTQSGSAANGTAIIGARTFTCNVPSVSQDLIDQVLASLPRENNSYPVGGTANEGGSANLTIAGIPFTGTYSRTNMDLTGNLPATPGLSTLTMTLKVNRSS